jgi:hypothetical protein
MKNALIRRFARVRCSVTVLIRFSKEEHQHNVFFRHQRCSLVRFTEWPELHHFSSTAAAPKGLRRPWVSSFLLPLVELLDAASRFFCAAETVKNWICRWLNRGIKLNNLSSPCPTGSLQHVVWTACGAGSKFRSPCFLSFHPNFVSSVSIGFPASCLELPVCPGFWKSLFASENYQSFSIFRREVFWWVQDTLEWRKFCWYEKNWPRWN